MCFHAFKQGWLNGCRKIIGFDGCFLKGACKGELLVSVGKNSNNQIYPIPWTVVDTEIKHSWDWSIRHLIGDLNLGTGEGLTVMSDQQKVPLLNYFSHYLILFSNNISILIILNTYYRILLLF